MKQYWFFTILGFLLVTMPWSPAEASQNAAWDRFDEHIQGRILSYLPGDELIQIGQVSKGIRRLACETAKAYTFKPKKMQDVAVEDLLAVTRNKPLTTLFSGVSLRGISLSKSSEYFCVLSSLRSASFCVPSEVPNKSSKAGNFSCLLQDLALNTTLTRLDLSYNRLTDEDAALLSGNTTLTEMNLTGNWIGDKGAIALSANTTLKQLDLRYNRIEAAGQEALRANTSLKRLNTDYQRNGVTRGILDPATLQTPLANKRLKSGYDAQ